MCAAFSCQSVCSLTCCCRRASCTWIVCAWCWRSVDILGRTKPLPSFPSEVPIADRRRSWDAWSQRRHPSAKPLSHCAAPAIRSACIPPEHGYRRAVREGIMPCHTALSGSLRCQRPGTATATSLVRQYLSFVIKPLDDRSTPKHEVCVAAARRLCRFVASPSRLRSCAAGGLEGETTKTADRARSCTHFFRTGALDIAAGCTRPVRRVESDEGGRANGLVQGAPGMCGRWRWIELANTRIRSPRRCAERERVRGVLEDGRPVGTPAGSA